MLNRGGGFGGGLSKILSQHEDIRGFARFSDNLVISTRCACLAVNLRDVTECYCACQGASGCL